ncbi:unnamed protein product [Schistocephalus solidus]|uniref:Reverse transcriptase domain-containing protein n=1 Tax=Schistocephalus solidus TaxID=70667 RepID=A0A183T5G1_SCHSO|nr:unnamed protein product [Schistocephalus solidus]
MVNHDGLWKVMEKFGCPEWFMDVVPQLHYGIRARITDTETVFEEFAVTNRVKQGCEMASTFSSVMLSVMLMDAYVDECPVIHITYETVGHLLNSRRMQDQTHVSTTALHDLLFADMQRSMELFDTDSASQTG